MSDDVICKHCGHPILEGQSWHTLAEMHYDCYEQKFGAPKPREHVPVAGRNPRTPRFEGLRLARASGGHLVHLVSGDTGLALCGHEPKSGGTNRMVDRSGWNFIRPDWTPSGSYRFCTRCEAKKPTPAAIAGLDAVIERCTGEPR